MSNIYLEGSSSEEFIGLLCAKIREIVDSAKQTEKQEPEVLLTREETAEFLKISMPTLHAWTKAGELTPRYIGRRVYYRKSEILNNPKNKKS